MDIPAKGALFLHRLFLLAAGVNCTGRSAALSVLDDQELPVLVGEKLLLPLCHDRF